MFPRHYFEATSEVPLSGNDGLKTGWALKLCEKEESASTVCCVRASQSHVQASCSISLVQSTELSHSKKSGSSSGANIEEIASSVGGG